LRGHLSRTSSFYVPPSARWGHLLNDVHKGVGEGLNKALAALEQEHPALDGVLGHIDFNRQVGQTTLGDRKLRDLIRHFNRYRLRNDDFEFPDLLGAAYEYLIAEFADSAGKKGGEFYTPRSVVRMLVRLVNPQPGMTVYDPGTAAPSPWPPTGRPSPRPTSTRPATGSAGWPRSTREERAQGPVPGSGSRVCPFSGR